MEDLASRRVSYVYEPKSGPGGDFEGEDRIVDKSAEVFISWFNNLGIEWKRRKQDQMYLPPLLAIIKIKNGVSTIQWVTNTSFEFSKPSDILRFCFAVGEINEKEEIYPDAFALSVDDKLWPDGGEKNLFRVTFPDGRTKMRSSTIKSKNGKAVLSKNLKKLNKYIDITLSASNAFWVGVGMGTRHTGPNVSITPNNTPNTDIGYESIDLGSPNSRKRERTSNTTSSSEGSVYVLTNVEIPDKIKIGHTKRSAQERARELSGTGVPGKWRVAYDIDVAQPERIEKKVHRQLSHLRSQEGEFFEVDPRKAAKVIKSEAQKH